MAHRPPSRSFLSPASRRLVAGLLIAAGILLILGELLRVYVMVVQYQRLGVVGLWPAAGTGLGLAAGVLTTYAGGRLGQADS